MFSIVVAKDSEDVIGVNGGLAYRFPKDLKRFQEITKGHTVIMGRKTFESIGHPLKDRENIVLTRDASYENDNVTVLYDKDTIYKYILDNIFSPEEIFVIGGESIYEMFINCCTKMYITLIQGCEYYNCNQTSDNVYFFPDFNHGAFDIESIEEILDTDEVCGKSKWLTFVNYKRKNL